MRWKYHIPHIWEENERAIWEDIYLLPEGGSSETPSIWLTIDALGTLDSPDHDWTPEDFAKAEARIGSSDFHISGTDMHVRGDSFTRSELVGWARVWLLESGFPVESLVEAPVEDFADSNEHAALVAALKAKSNE